MFDIGFWELVLISVVGLVVLGPERLPVAIRNVSRWVGAAKRMAGSVKDELEQELKLQELRDNLKKAEQMGMKDISPDLQRSVDELKRTAEEVQRPYAKATDTQAASPSQPVAETATESATESKAGDNSATKQEKSE
ncbi:Sec-independent protein translocase protein TatB [Parasalinivibrio latis]|uniref:Sec-independent protein translocase protein TatB n=1 Tax=Parasalinivibrio latis TaxID=2952610 RepID=UPI0030E4B9C1